MKQHSRSRRRRPPCKGSNNIVTLSDGHNCKLCCRRCLSRRPAPRNAAPSDSPPGLRPTAESVPPALDGMRTTAKSSDRRPADTGTGCTLSTLQPSLGEMQQQRFQRVLNAAWNDALCSKIMLDQIKALEVRIKRSFARKENTRQTRV